MCSWERKRGRERQIFLCLLYTGATQLWLVRNTDVNLCIWSTVCSVCIRVLFFATMASCNHTLNTDTLALSVIMLHFEIKYTFHSSKHSINITYICCHEWFWVIKVVLCTRSHDRTCKQPEHTRKGQGSFWLDFHNILHDCHMGYITWRRVPGVSLVFLTFLLGTCACSCVDLISWKELGCMLTM